MYAVCKLLPGINYGILFITNYMKGLSHSVRHVSYFIVPCRWDIFISLLSCGALTLAEAAWKKKKCDGRQMDRLMDGRTERRADWWSVRQRDGQPDGRTDWWTAWRTDKQTHRKRQKLSLCVSLSTQMIQKSDRRDDNKYKPQHLLFQVLEGLSQGHQKGYASASTLPTTSSNTRPPSARTSSRSLWRAMFQEERWMASLTFFYSDRHSMDIYSFIFWENFTRSVLNA